MTNHQLGTKVKLIVFSLSLSVLLSGCVGRTAPHANENSAQTSAEHNDPFETINRSIYGVIAWFVRSFTLRRK